MFRSRILTTTRLYGNIFSKNELIIAINQRPSSNPKKQYFHMIINENFYKNYELVRNEIRATVFTTSNKDNLHNNDIKYNKSKVQNLSHEHSKHQYFSHSINTFAKNNTLYGSSTLLSPKYNFNKTSCINSMGVRNLSSEAPQNAPVTYLPGLWKDISESSLVQFVQENLISFHTYTNLPWWATIILTTFIIRGTMTLPLSVYQHYILAKVQNLGFQMNDIVKQLKIEANYAVTYRGCTENAARMVYNRSLKKEWNKLIVKENCHPAKGFIILWIQIPIWITISAALRNLCYMLPPGNPNAETVYMELTTGGFGWVTNLIDVDHFWIIPVSVGLFNLANVEVMSLLKSKETRLQRYLLYFFRTISLAMIPIGCYVPSCICIYWASSSAFGLCQNLFLLSPNVRRSFGIPLTSTERATPYSDLVKEFRAKKYINFSRKSTSLE